jgi:hypothetical protein
MVERLFTAHARQKAPAQERSAQVFTARSASRGKGEAGRGGRRAAIRAAKGIAETLASVWSNGQRNGVRNR